MLQLHTCKVLWGEPVCNKKKTMQGVDSATVVKRKEKKTDVAGVKPGTLKKKKTFTSKDKRIIEKDWNKANSAQRYVVTRKKKKTA